MSKAKMSKTDAAWMKFYQKLADYKLEHGHTSVSAPSVSRMERLLHGTPAPEYEQLARWVSRQRQQHKSGKLPGGRFQLLEDLEFYWCPSDRVWDERYEELCRTQKNVGEPVYIPSNRGQAEVDNDKSKKRYSDREMQWANQQRIQYMLRQFGKHSQINDRRIAKLERIGFQWWKDEADKKIIESLAGGDSFRYSMRKIDNFALMQAINKESKKAEAKSMTTDKPVPVIVTDYGRKFVLQLEADKQTHILVPIDSADVNRENAIFVMYVKGKKAHIITTEP